MFRVRVPRNSVLCFVRRTYRKVGYNSLSQGFGLRVYRGLGFIGFRV